MSVVESFAWVPTSIMDCDHLLHRAIIAGFEGYHQNYTIYVARVHHEGELLPCKAVPEHKKAYAAYCGREIEVVNIELYCRENWNINWVAASNGIVPPGAVVAGHDRHGETLYVGRATHSGALTPGKVHPLHKCLYLPYGGYEISKQNYEVMVLYN